MVGRLFLLAALFTCCSATEIPWPFYHSLADTLDFFETVAVRHPTLVRFAQMTDEESGDQLPLVTITDFAVEDDKKETVLLVFAEHAREIITTEISIWLTKVLVGDVEAFESWPATVSMHAENAVRGVGPETGETPQWTGHLLQHVIFKLFPVVNIEGRKRVERGEFCMRMKANGVDLNRNYPVAFQKLRPNSGDYGGPSPFSEPESRIIRAEVTERDRKPLVYVSVHSGEWALYFPWDSKMHRGEMLPNTTEALVEKMNIHCKCMNGPAGKVAGYLALGSSMDYMYDIARVAYPLTVEVYGPDGLGTFAAGGHPRRLQQVMGGRQPLWAPSLRCLTEYNPPSESLYQDTVARWVGSFLAMADFLAPYRSADSGAAGEGHPSPPERQVPSALDVEQKIKQINMHEHASVSSSEMKGPGGAHAHHNDGAPGVVSKPKSSEAVMEERQGRETIGTVEPGRSDRQQKTHLNQVSVSFGRSQGRPISLRHHGEFSRGQPWLGRGHRAHALSAMVTAATVAVIVVWIQHCRAHPPKNRTL